MMGSAVAVFALCWAAAPGLGPGRHTHTPAARRGPAASSSSARVTPPSGISFSGYVETSFSHSSAPVAGHIAGRLFGRFQDQFMLNGVKLALDKAYDATRLDAGFHVDLFLGQDAAVIQAAGLSLGDQGDMPQAYVVLNVPTSNGDGVQLKAGKMIALPGVESAYDVVNSNVSLGYQAVYVEMATGTGVDVDHRFSEHVEAELRVLNGWDAVQDVNSHPSVGGRVNLAADTLTALNLVGWMGPEEPGDNASDRYGVDAVASRVLGAGASADLQLDWGGEQANAALPDPTRAARWWGAGGWLSFDVATRLGVALRVDYLDDEEGARTSGVLDLPQNTGQRLGSGTVTLNIRHWQDVLLRPELRFDRSSLPAFAGKKTQVTLAVSLACLF